MFVIGVAGLKGGVGKSTVAINLACALHQGRRRVLLVDVDPQGTCRAWSARADEAGRSGPPVVSLAGDSLRRDLGRVSAGYDVVIIDAPPRLGVATRAAIVASHLVLLPVVPGSADVWALEETIEIVKKARSFRPDLLAAILMNRTDRTRLSRHVTAAVEGLDVPVLGASLGARVTFGEATLAGQGVVDYDRKSEAAVEVRRLARRAMALGAAS